jgi:hypothetical protein
MSRICILGWGSLVFHPQGDAALGQTPLATVGTWALDGPELKVEFSRISSGKRLTLVVDPANGTANQVFTIQSACDSLEDAAENLRLRESRTRRSWIGRLTKTECVPVTEPGKTIGEWLAHSTYDAVVWTAIPPNFPEERNCPFSLAAADTYLESLDAIDRAKAFEYMVEAPDEISTELRKQARWSESVATHEAGHFVVSCALGRPVLRLSRVPVDDRPPEPATTGCRYADTNQPDPILFACDFAGPLSQIGFLPTSVAARKLATFQSSILVLPGNQNLYSWTGWMQDLTAALQTIAIPPQMAAMMQSLTLVDLRRLESQIAAFLRIDRVGHAIKHTRDALMASSVITGAELASLTSVVNGHLAPLAGRAYLLAGFTI